MDGKEGRLLAGLPEDARPKLRRRAQPSWVSPMLATLAKRTSLEKGFVFERKLDGERCLAFGPARACA